VRAAIEILAALLLVGGATIVALAALGVARLPDPFSRMHAAAKAGVAGAGLVLLGAGLAFGTVGAMLTAVAAVAFLILTAPLASHTLGRAAYVAGAPLGAAHVADALAGILDRRVFDIDPGRTVRPRSAHRLSPREDYAMTAVPEFRRPADPAGRDAPALDPAPARRILCCLVGGEAQRAATEAAIDLARATGAQVTGLSGAGLQPRVWRGPLPIGGSFWSDWLTTRSRARIRQGCAEALEEFQSLTAGASDIDVVARHEETQAADFARLLAGQDLAVLPAGAGPHGAPVEPGLELAASLAHARVVPVLRVRQWPRRIRAVLLVVGETPACGALAAGLLRSGLWATAPVSILPVAEERPGVVAMVNEQAELLRMNGRRVAILPALDADFDMAEARRLLARFDASVMARLSSRHGGILDSLRICAFETVADSVPVTLLP
jgi:monovalent cation/proton antiporter MnhG/PhaG subunit